jgi:ligand-binding sensor protein
MVEKKVISVEVWEKVLASPILEQTAFLLTEIFRRDFGFGDFEKMGITREDYFRIRGPAKRHKLSFPFCEFICSNKTGRERCAQDDYQSYQVISTTKKVYFHACHAGLTELYVPIIIQGDYYGCFSVAGGLLFHPPTEEGWTKITQQVKDIGVDLERLKQSYFQIIPTSQELLEVMVKLINVIIEEIVKILLESASDKKRIIELENELSEKYRFANIIGKSKSMQTVFKLLESTNTNDSPILIQGETGTGKELVAQAIHYNSLRKDKSFLAQNCAAFSESLLESELFGHIKGAFTGAIKDHRGLFMAADGGTIFLDEIAEMSPQMQAKLLRVVEYGDVKHVEVISRSEEHTSELQSHA